MSHEWRVDVGAKRPNPNEMTDFNVLTFNSKSFPATQPLLMRTGERVRIRLGNLSPMEHHPIDLHGLNFVITETDGGRVPRSAQYPETTVLVHVGSTRVIELVATEPGDWAMHCHMTHHVMTQMGHELPVMVGVNTKKLDKRMGRVAPEYMTMGTTGMGGMGEMEMPIPSQQHSHARCTGTVQLHRHGWHVHVPQGARRAVGGGPDRLLQVPEGNDGGASRCRTTCGGRHRAAWMTR